MKLIKKIFLLSSVFLISSCGATGNSTSSNTSDVSSSLTDQDSTSSVQELKDIKDFINYFNTSKNYSFDFYIGKNLSNSLLFCENVIGTYSEDTRSLLDLYVQDSDGVYKLNYFNKEYVSSEYLLNSLGNKVYDVWSGELVSTLYGQASSLLSKLDNGLTEYEISDKTYKLAILTTLGFERSAILEASNITTTIEDNNISFTFTLESKTYKLVSKNIGTSYSEDYNVFINEGGTVYKPGYSLGGFKKLMKMNNYRDENISGEDPFYELFNENYFISQYPNSNVLSGYIGLNTSDHKGLFSFSASGNLKNLPTDVSNISILSTPINSNYDVPSLMNYPSNLLILDNLQFLNEGELEIIGFEPVGDTYYTNDSSFLIDFGNNFNIFTNMPYESYTPYGLMIDIYYSEQNTADSLVDFYYCFNYYDSNLGLQAGVLQFKFSEFGNCDIATLDSVVSGDIQ